MVQTITETSTNETEVTPEPATEAGSGGPRCSRCGRKLDMSLLIGTSIASDRLNLCCFACLTVAEIARAERNLRNIIQNGNTKAAIVDLLRLRDAKNSIDRGGK